MLLLMCYLMKFMHKRVMMLLKQLVFILHDVQKIINILSAQLQSKLETLGSLA